MLIFLHDWFTTPEDEWQFQRDQFCPIFSCRFPVLAGHRPSRQRRESPQLNHPSPIEESLIRLEAIAASQSGPIRIVAHGISAHLALHFALQHPKRVRALTLISPIVDPQLLPLLRWRKRYRLAPLILLYSINHWLYQPGGQRDLRRGLEALPLRHLRCYLDDLLDPTSILRLPGKQRNHRLPPTLVLTGDRSPWNQFGQLEWLQREMPEALLVRYAALGDSPHQEAPELINSAILEHIKSSTTLMERSFGSLRALFRNLLGR